MISLSPSERKEVLKMIADRIVAELRAEAGGDFASLIVLPMSAVSQLVGLSTSRIPHHLAVTTGAAGKHGVTIRNIQDFISKNTKQPAA